MIDEQSTAFLTQLAQIALALAGFASVVAAFRPLNRMKDVEKEGMKLILESSFGAAFFALFPFPVLYIRKLFPGLAEYSAWRWSAGILAAFLVFLVVLNIRRVRKLSKGGTPARMERELKYILLPVTLLAIGALVLTGFNGDKLGYSVALFWMLSVAGIQFFVFLFKSVLAPDP
jgi:hypothetical protein